jgi:N-acetylmuramoyl-L-alanine amidase
LRQPRKGTALKKSIVCTVLVLFSASAYAADMIAVDVGHSLVHPGAVSARGKSEFSYNMRLAKKIARAVSDGSAAAVLVGEDGRMDGLYERTKAAAGAGFLLSVHHDAAKPQYLKIWKWHAEEHLYSDRFSGFGLFVSRKNPYPAESLRCASAIGKELQRAGFHHSIYHADAIEGEGREWADEANGVYYFDDLVVLRTALQPAVLFEAGVIVNRQEEKNLMRSDVQERIALAVKAGLIACGAMH